MTFVYIDHNILRSYYTQKDVKIFDIYVNNMSLDDISWRQEDYVNDKILIILNKKYVITCFSIKSTTSSVGHVCINDNIISEFHIAQGNHEYEHIILSGEVKLILNRHCISDVKMSCICKSLCYGTKKYLQYNDEFAHRIIKVNDFGPKIVYHGRNCSHSNWHSFDDRNRTLTIKNDPFRSSHSYRDSYITCENMGVSCIKNVGFIIIITKINEITRRIIHLLKLNNCVIRDVILHIGIIMYHIV